MVGEEIADVEFQYASDNDAISTLPTVILLAVMVPPDPSDGAFYHQGKKRRRTGDKNRLES